MACWGSIALTIIALVLVGYAFRYRIVRFIQHNLTCASCGNLGFMVDNEGYKTCPYCSFGDEIRKRNPES